MGLANSATNQRRLSFAAFQILLTVSLSASFKCRLSNLSAYASHFEARARR
jgi:hypothetical protein